MTVQKTDRWVGANRITLPQALAFALRNAQRVPDAQAFATEQYRICVAMGWDFLLSFGQANEESANLTHSWWVNRLNAVNIGVTGKPSDDAISPTYSSGTESAQAWAYHLALYLGAQASPVVSGYRHLDPHATNVEQAGYVGIAKTLEDLTGRWATDPAYGQAIADRANAINPTASDQGSKPTPAPVAGGGNTPMPTATLNMTQDLIPLPDGIITKIITDAENTAWDVLGQKEVWAFVLHRQLGTNDGTDQYFRTMANAHTTGAGGLTEFGQRATGGELFLWNSPGGFGGNGVTANRAPWASGRFNVHGDAYGDGLAFEQKYGLNAINGKAAAWEIDGWYNDPWSDAAQQEAAQACAHFAHNREITYIDFPMFNGVSFTIWHQEITGPAEKICPGPVVMDATPAWIERVRAIMKTAQTGSSTPVTPSPPPKQPKYAKPHPIVTASIHAIPYRGSLPVIAAYTPRQVASDKRRSERAGDSGAEFQDRQAERRAARLAARGGGSDHLVCVKWRIEAPRVGLFLIRADTSIGRLVSSQAILDNSREKGMRNVQYQFDV